MLTINITPTLDGNTYILNAEVTASDPMPIQVFLYRTELDGTEVYSAICSPDSIDKYPADDPIGGIPFFRKSTLYKTFTSYTALQTFIEVLQADLLQLDIDYQAIIDEIGFGETTTVVINEE